MAKKGKDKSSSIIRGAGDDDVHVRTSTKLTVTNREHMAYGGGLYEDQAMHLREPFRSRVLNPRKRAKLPRRTS